MQNSIITECWKPIPGFEGKYEASSLGRIRSLNYNHTGKAKVLSLTLQGNGYLRLSLHNNGKQKSFSVQRLIYTAFKGAIPDGLVVDHVNNIKTDNRIENLQLLTPGDNVRKSWRGKTLSEAQKAKLKGKTPWNKGKQLSEEYRAKMRAGQKGKKHSAETRAKIAATLKGKPLTEERKAKISASLKARYQREKDSGITR